MKPTELRVGNIISLIHEEWGDMPAVITSINDCGDLCLRCLGETNTDEEYECTMNEVYPIPITKEILLKNGFYDNGKAQFYYPLKDKGRITIMCATDDYKSWLVMVDSMRYEKFISTDASNHNAQYVHELQNVIQMAKVDKEIVL